MSVVQPNGVVHAINPKLISPNGTGSPPAAPQLSCVPARLRVASATRSQGKWANLQLDAFNGPAYFDWDLSAAKDFSITERFKLTFRTEAFNVLKPSGFPCG